MANSIADILSQRQAIKEQGNWIPACGGTEVPFKKGHYTYLYVYQATTGRHAYLCIDTDLILSDEEAWAVMGA